MSIVRTPDNLRKIARSQDYPDKVVREVLEGAADDLQAVTDGIQGRGYLLDNLSMTIAACVISVGGKVEVPKIVMEELGGYDLEKSPGDPSTYIYVVYQTRRKEAPDA